MNNLKEARKAKKLTQGQIADYLGIDQSTYSYWESGRSKIDGDTVGRLAVLLEVSADYLLGLTDKKEPPASEDNERLRAVLAGTEGEKVKLALDMMDQLTPENRKKAEDYLQYLLDKQAGAGGK